MLFMVKNRRSWLPELHHDPRTPHEEMLVIKSWGINILEKLRQHITHPLGNFSKISPGWYRGGFLCLLEIGGRGEGRGKISELPDNYPHCASLTLQSRPRPCASTPSTGTHAHRNLTYTYHLRVSPPGWQSLWQLGTTKAFFPHSAPFPRLPAPQPRGAAERGSKCPTDIRQT